MISTCTVQVRYIHLLIVFSEIPIKLSYPLLYVHMYFVLHCSVINALCFIYQPVSFIVKKLTPYCSITVLLIPHVSLYFCVYIFRQAVYDSVIGIYSYTLPLVIFSYLYHCTLSPKY